MMNWLLKHWYNATIFLAIYTTVLLVMYVSKQNFALFLIWLQTPVYFMHEFEEYILPGGFKSFFNTKIMGSQNSQFPLTDKVSFWINVPVIFIAMPVSAILATYFGLGWGIWTAAFSVLNAAAHVAWFFKFKYNPGLVVSVLLNIPVGCYAIWYFIQHQLVTTPVWIISIIFGVMVQVVMTAYGFVVLKPKVAQVKP